ncbi:hypothetical protein BWI17_21880 [Betaproteobacteria bacterium GR16-43]|nr:hypothetical protein BWI17_21880 [Betaproteobacteria bacterium GR16-43]
MKKRQEYVDALKVRLDQWNADVAKWEAQAASAREDLRERYKKELDVVRARREEAQYQMKLLQGASATAWEEFTKGADEAWDRMQAAIAQASKHFAKTSK